MGHQEDFSRGPPQDPEPPEEVTRAEPNGRSTLPGDSTSFVLPPAEPLPADPCASHKNLPAPTANSAADSSTTRDADTTQDERRRSFRVRDGPDENDCLPDQPDSTCSRAPVDDSDTLADVLQVDLAQRYRLIKHLGQGGFSDVYLAIDLTLNRKVAIKIPRTETHSPAEMQEHFLFEARVAAHMDHPNVVPVYDAGWYGDSGYIIYAYVSGYDLKRWICESEGRLSPRNAAEIMLQVCRGVAHAHSRGILHRDLKPSNVLLEPLSPPTDDKRESTKSSLPFVPKVTDFGLAWFQGEAGRRSSDGVLLGTLAYMSPEQAAGGAESAATATDVYGLGTILYELLTGAPPFSPTENENLIQFLARIRTALPEPPRRRRADIPGQLELICLKCLQKAPRHRYPTADELAEHLTRFLHGRAS